MDQFAELEDLLADFRTVGVVEAFNDIHKGIHAISIENEIYFLFIPLHFLSILPVLADQGIERLNFQPFLEALVVPLFESGGGDLVNAVVHEETANLQLLGCQDKELLMNLMPLVSDFQNSLFVGFVHQDVEDHDFDEEQVDQKHLREVATDVHFPIDKVELDGIEFFPQQKL